MFACSGNKWHACVSGVRPEATARGRVPAEDGRIVRVRALHSQPSQGSNASQHPIIPLNNTFYFHTPYKGACAKIVLPPPAGVFPLRIQRQNVDGCLGPWFIFQQSAL